MTNHPHAARIHRRIDLLLIAITIAILVLIVCTSARADGGPATWNGSQNNNWLPSQTGGNQNWNTGNHNFPGTVNTTTNADTATFNIGGGNPTITLNPSLITGGTSLNLQNITFTTSSVGAFTIGTTGGPTLRLTNGGTIQMTATVANNETVNAPLELEPATSTTAGSYTFLNDATSATNVLTFGGTVTGGTTSSTIALSLGGTNTGANTVSGTISNGGASGGLSVTKNSGGTWKLTGNNTYTGTTTINGGTLNANGSGSNQALGGTSGVVVNGSGTLLLSSSNQINNSATMSLNGGTLRLAGVSEGTAMNGGAGVGALTLAAAAGVTSTIDFSGASGIIQFGGIAQTNNGSLLNITNWNGSLSGGGAEQLLFSGTASSFTSIFTQSEVLFGGVAGYNTVQFSGFYEIVPVPEPSTWIGGALTVGVLGFTQRRRFARLIKRAA